MGPLEDLLGMMPGMNKIKGMKDLQIDEKQIGRVEAIVQFHDQKRKSRSMHF